ncbi:MAG TPA: HAD family hydrolase, partial [Polyangiaceae bacterium]|nr:HAD family hydrolase [Polyangiaceae bacterium]
LVVTDLDGTLLDSERRLGALDRATLLELGARGIVRVVATGRSLFSAEKVLSEDFPIDYLVFSSGAGIVRWPHRQLLEVQHMSAASALSLVRRLRERGLDFMLHRAIPDNHQFFTHRTERPNHDFDQRVRLYADYAQPLELPLRVELPMCQALVIEPPPGPGCYPELVAELADFSVIRATSPLDGASTWIEVFPAGVSKAAAARWLRSSLGREHAASLAVGNDYNDLELLDWADVACVVSNAPPELRSRYRTVACNDEGGFSAAVRAALDV